MGKAAAATSSPGQAQTCIGAVKLRTRHFLNWDESPDGQNIINLSVCSAKHFFFLGGKKGEGVFVSF